MSSGGGFDGFFGGGGPRKPAGLFRLNRISQPVQQFLLRVRVGSAICGLARP